MQSGPSSRNDEIIPSGLALRNRLRAHPDTITEIAWSPNGNILASGSVDSTVLLWEVQTKRWLQTLGGHYTLLGRYLCGRSPTTNLCKALYNVPQKLGAP